MDKKRRVRHFLNWLLMLAFAGSLLMLTFLGWVWYGAYNQNTLNESLNQMDYYESRYQVFEERMNEFLQLLGVSENAVDRELIYTRFLVESKLAVTLTEEREDAWKAGSDIRSQLENYFDTQGITLTEKAREGLARMEEDLNELSASLYGNSQLYAWNQEREVLREELPHTLMKSVGLMAVSLLLLVLIQHKKRFALPYIGIGVLLSGVCMLGFCIWGLLGGIMEGLMKNTLVSRGLEIGGLEVSMGVVVLLFPKFMAGAEKR